DRRCAHLREGRAVRLRGGERHLRLQRPRYARARAADARASLQPGAHRHGGELPFVPRADAQPGPALPAAVRRAPVRARAHPGGEARPHLPAERLHRVPVPDPAVGSGLNYSGKTVLAVGAHADDIELAVGGTMARLRRAGARVVMLVGSLPGDTKRRRCEAEQAARILGCELRVLLEDGGRIEDLKSYELVA